MRETGLALMAVVMISLAGCCCASPCCGEVAAGFERVPGGRIQPAAAAGPQVLLETQCLMVKGPNFLSDIGADAGATLLDDTEVEVILRAVEKSERVERLAMPTIVTQDGEEATIEVMESEGAPKAVPLQHRVEMHPRIGADRSIAIAVSAIHRAYRTEGPDAKRVAVTYEIERQVTIPDQGTVLLTSAEPPGFLLLVKATILEDVRE